MPPSLVVAKQLTNVIKRFKFEEWEKSVLPTFPELSWNRLRSTLVRHHEGFSVANALKIIERTITDAQLHDNDLRDRLATLELIAVSRHHKRKTWYGHELRGAETQPSFQINEEISNKVEENFHVNNLRVDARVITHETITFVSITELRSGKSKRTVKMTPTYFAFFQGQNHIFCSKKTIRQDYLMAMAQSLGFANSRPAKLSGRDLESLYKMIWNKKQCAINSANIFQPPVYQQCKPVVRSTGTDFTEHRQRREFMDKCLGEDPPMISMLAVNVTNRNWKFTKSKRNIRMELGSLRFEIRSTSVPNVLKTFVERRILETPLPDYAMNLMNLGRNELTLRSGS